MSGAALSILNSHSYLASDCFLHQLWSIRFRRENWIMYRKLSAYPFFYTACLWWKPQKISFLCSSAFQSELSFLRSVKLTHVTLSSIGSHVFMNRSSSTGHCLCTDHFPISEWSRFLTFWSTQSSHLSLGIPLDLLPLTSLCYSLPDSLVGLSLVTSRQDISGFLQWDFRFRLFVSVCDSKSVCGRNTTKLIFLRYFGIS